MSIIKVNYNNAAIKKPTKLIPYFYCFKFEELNQDGTFNKVLRIEVDSRIDEESFFDGYVFEVYLNDNLIAYITKTSDQYIELVNDECFSDESFNIRLKGYYTDIFDNQYKFTTEYVEIFNYILCSNIWVCSERILCTDYLYGYINNDFTIFYTTYDGLDYDGEVDPTSFNGRYIDIPSRKVYKWDSNESKYKLL